MRGQNDEKIMEDDNGVVVARVRDNITFKDRLEKVFTERNNSMDSPDYSRSPHGSATSSSSHNQWEIYLQEIETYFQDLLSSNTNNDEQISLEHQDNGVLGISGIEPDDDDDDDVREQNNSNNKPKERIEILKGKLEEARKIIPLQMKEAKDQSDRHANADWAISLCNTRAQELEGKIKEEMNMKEELAKELETERETMYETRRGFEESRKRLSSLLELQLELSNKLQISTQARSQAEIQLENATNTRSEMVADIDQLQRQRGVLYSKGVRLGRAMPLPLARKKYRLYFIARYFALLDKSLNYFELSIDGLGMGELGMSKL